MSPAPKCGYDITQGCAGSSTRFVFHARQCDIARCPLSRCLQLWPGPHQLLLSAGRGPGSCASPPGVWGDEFSMGELIFACLQSLSEHKRGMKTLTSKAGPRDDFKRSRNAAGAWLGCGPWGAGGACGCTGSHSLASCCKAELAARSRALGCWVFPSGPGAVTYRKPVPLQALSLPVEQELLSPGLGPVASSRGPAPAAFAQLSVPWSCSIPGTCSCCFPQPLSASALWTDCIIKCFCNWGPARATLDIRKSP